MIELTNQQARQFILYKNGLIHDYRFSGKQGIVDYVRQAGCMQYDPIDVCGKNTELVLQSRVKGFTKKMFNDVLYDDRDLIDYPDKQLSVICKEDWKYFERYRKRAREHGERYPKMLPLMQEVRDYIRENGAISSSDLKFDGDFYWQSAIHWSSGKNLTRSVLEQMYSTGDLIIHHKNGSRKFYDLAENHISPEILNADEPFPDMLDHQKWRVLRRIGGVGLLWNRPSDAWLNIWDLETDIRNDIFNSLVDEGKIIGIKVDGIRSVFYCLSDDLPIIELILRNPEFKPRCELIAPLDNMMWDRKLINELFGYHYSWEIYTPDDKRKYGFYVLPLIYGDKFIGRVEAVADKKENILNIKNIWYEADVKHTKNLRSAVTSCFARFAQFNQCKLNLSHTATF